MAETAKYGAFIITQMIKKLTPFALAAIGGFMAAGYPALFNAFCQVN